MPKNLVQKKREEEGTNRPGEKRERRGGWLCCLASVRDVNKFLGKTEVEM